MTHTIDSNTAIFGVYGESLYDRCYLMTSSELIFFRRLTEYIRDTDYIICPKVRLGDIVAIDKRRWHRMWTFIGRPWTVSGKLDRSHIDFLLIDGHTSMIKCGIELDDPSHNTRESQYHDRVKNEAFDRVGLKLHRFTSEYVTPEELAKTLI
jgi:Protein of unknown function (DUF2726)